VTLASLLAFIASHAAAMALPLADALTVPSLNASLRLDASGNVFFEARNTSSTLHSINVPAGSVLLAADSARWLTIRDARIDLAPGEKTDTRLPAVSMSILQKAAAGPLSISSEQTGGYEGLILFSKAHDDLPRPTAQLATWILIENITYAQWIATLTAGSAPADPATFPLPPEHLITAIDALAIVRGLHPERTFALADAAEFRVRALRFPATRARAMTLFGIAPPEGIPETSLQDLLHTKPGDNCPICRWRGKMSAPASGF
jgi:hypothetical protein